MRRAGFSVVRASGDFEFLGYFKMATSSDVIYETLLAQQKVLWEICKKLDQMTATATATTTSKEPGEAKKAQAAAAADQKPADAKKSDPVCASNELFLSSMLFADRALKPAPLADSDGTASPLLTQISDLLPKDTTTTQTVIQTNADTSTQSDKWSKYNGKFGNIVNDAGVLPSNAFDDVVTVISKMTGDLKAGYSLTGTATRVCSTAASILEENTGGAVLAANEMTTP